MVTVAVTASAYDFKAGGLCYQINGTNVTVVQDDSYATTLSGALNIPSQVTNNGTTYTVNTIGIDAFNGCSGITSIVIPNTVKMIYNRAFQGCLGLTSFNLPASVTYIAASALQYCDNLTTITVDSNNQTYDSRNNCNAICHTSLNNLCRACNTTVIPSSIQAIDYMAFSGCKITSIDIPENVKSIFDQAFSNCSNLATVTLPSTLQTMGKFVFEYCSALTSITIPASVVLIDEGILSGCSSLESIVVDSQNQYYDSRDNCNAIITKNYNQSYAPAKPANILIQGCKNTTIPATVTTIGKNAFKECPITDIEITEGVKKIETSGFNYCTSLKTVTLPASLENIGIYGFNGCSGLTDIYAYPTGGSVTLQPNAWMNMNQASCNLHVYPEDYNYYSTADQWKEFNVIPDLGLSGQAMYLIGSFNGWDQNSQLPLLKGADGKWTITQAMDAGAEFKFRNEDGTWIGGDSNGNFLITKEQVENGTELTMIVGGGNNFQIPVAGEWTFTVDRENNTLVVSGEWNEQVIDPAMYIIGSFNDWDQNTQEAMTPGENNTWTITKTLEMGAQMKFRDEFGTWYGAFADGNFVVTKEQVEHGTAITLNTGDGYNNIEIPVAGTWTFTITRGEQMTLVISGNWPSDFPTGDVTGDGNVDIDDVNAVINIILKVKTEDDYPGVANINGDGEVDVDDMNAIINIILGQSNN